MMMNDREKVIKGLECCAAMSGDKCRECPYRHECLDTVLLYGIPHLAANALALLQPRVITREELKQFEDSPCWFESHGTYMGKEGFWIIPYMFTCYQTMYYVFPLLSANEKGDIHYSELGLSAYNKAWRCWTARPTAEQRKAVKWNDRQN